MPTKDQIATVFSNARELVRQNEPKAARAYVLILLDGALETYRNASTILLKAKTAAFLDQWITVSRELYSHGVTDFVRSCFGLPVTSAAVPAIPKRLPAEKPAKAPMAPAGPAGSAQPAPGQLPAPGTLSPGEIDIAGLIEESKETQGWCAEVFEKNKDAVVRISFAGRDMYGSGTGFIISPNGYLLTNDHVVYNEQAEAYHQRITMSRNGEKKKHKLEVLFSDQRLDIALCKFDPEEFGDAVCVKRIENYASLKQGADCLIIGNAFGMGLAPFSGVVRFTKDDEGNLVYTAPSNPGDSGGPVFNRKGECIGINKSRTVSFDSQEAEGYANATPMDSIDACLARWIKVNDIRL